MVARSALSFATRVYRGEEDQRGQEEEGEEGEGGGNGVPQPRPDGWVVFEDNTYFKPRQDELARLAVSDGVTCLLWAGSNSNNSRFVSFTVETEIVRRLDPHLDLPNVRFTIGHGINGELAASALREDGFFRILGVRSFRGGEWVDVAQIIVNNYPPQHYLPLSIYNRRRFADVEEFIECSEDHSSCSCIGSSCCSVHQAQS